MPIFPNALKRLGELLRAPVGIPTPPVAPVFTPTTMQTSVSDRGTTRTLQAAAPVGSYLTGDKFIVGGIITATSPASAVASGTFDNGTTPYTNRVVNGMEFRNAVATTTGFLDTEEQGLDSLDSDQATAGSTIRNFNAAVNKAPELTGSPISGNGVTKKAVSTATPNLQGRGNITAMSLVALVDAVPPINSFRPHESDGPNMTPFFSLADMDITFLPSIATPTSGALPTAAAIIGTLGPLQTFYTNNLYDRSINASGQQSGYGSDIANDIARAILFCCSTASAADKQLVANYLVQAGLDVWRRSVNAGRWSSATGSYGGGQHWVKALIVFAARVLRNSTNSAALASLTQYADFAQKPIFTEDTTINVVTRQQILTTPDTPDAGYSIPQYQNYMENTPDWNSKPSNLGGGGFSTTGKYRYVNFGTAGLLAALQLVPGAKAAWNNAVIFAFHDRWVNWWRALGKPTGGYQPADVAAWIDAQWPAFPAGAPAAVRTIARDNYVWIEFDKQLDINSIPASSAFAITVNGAAQTLPNPASTCTVTANSTVVTVASATGFLVGQQVTCSRFPYGTRIQAIAGTSLTLSEIPSSAGTLVAISATCISIFGYSLAVALPATLAGGETVVVGYTAPGTNAAKTLAGSNVASFSGVSAANLTGTLPAGATTIERVRNGSTAGTTTRQYARAAAPQSAAGSVSKLLIGQRVRLYSRTAGDTFLANATGSSSAFRAYLGSTTELRILLVNQSVRTAGLISAADEGVDLTYWLALDWTKTSQSALVANQGAGTGGAAAVANDVARMSKNGAVVHATTSSVITATGAFTTDPASLFSGGIGLFAIPGAGTNAGTSISDIAHQWTWIDWGGAGFALPADLTAAPFSNSFSPGGNGELVTGTAPRYFYAGTVAEANAQGMVNRGRGAPASMASLRTFTDGEDQSPYPYVLGA